MVLHNVHHNFFLSKPGQTVGNLGVQVAPESRSDEGMNGMDDISGREAKISYRFLANIYLVGGGTDPVETYYVCI